MSGEQARESQGQLPDPPPFEPFKLHSSERIYDSSWCGLRRDMLHLPDGVLQEYHVFEVTDAVAIVPVLPDGSLVLVWQYRYPHGKSHWEIPAGRISTGEAPAVAAERELLEETGYAPGRLLEIPGFYPTNGISAHYAHAFVALDCVEQSAPQPDASEQILVRVHSRAEVEALLREGKIADAFTALTVMHYLQFVAPKDD